MPEISIKYELRLGRSLVLEKVIFGYTDRDFGQDKDPSEPGYYRNLVPFSAYPSGDTLRIRILANGQEGFSWSLIVKVNGKAITDNPIEIACNSLGRTDYDDRINWR
jgi:hypothetical protein